jgi:hypothetical protein
MSRFSKNRGGSKICSISSAKLRLILGIPTELGSIRLSAPLFILESVHSFTLA